MFAVAWIYGAFAGASMTEKVMDNQMQSAPALRGYLLWVGLLLLLSVVALPFDLAVAEFHKAGSLPGDFQRFVTLSEVFAHGFGLITIGISIWLLAPHHRPRLPRLMLCGLLASGLAQLMKLGFMRFRPLAYQNLAHQMELPDTVAATWSEVEQPLHVARVGVAYFSQAFPSGHSALAVSVAACLCWLLPKGRWLFVTLATMACYQRVQSHAHWTSDVLAGAAVGMLVAGLLLQNWGLGWVLKWYENRAELASKTQVNQNVNS